MGIFSYFFGTGSEKLKDALRKGAVIIDVRTPHEFDFGHIPGALNIPVDRVKTNADRIRQLKKPVIICSHNFADAAEVIELLRALGINESLNGGNWESLLRKIR